MKPSVITVAIITRYALLLKIENNRLKEATKMTVVKVIHMLDRRKSQGTPPKIRTIASNGRVIAFTTV